MIITSLENNKIKELTKLKKKKYRDLTSNFLVEGEHLVEEALKANRVLELILVEGYDISADKDIPKTFVSYEIMSKLSDLDTPTKVIGVCYKDEEKEIIGSHILILDELQDPGNLGTIIRSAVAFDIDTIILSENTVDLYNSKVIRATQGMLFYTHIISYDCVEAINIIKSMNIPLYGTDVNGGVDVNTLTPTQKNKYALIMGNEGNGVRSHIKKLCDKNLYISMNNRVESLNVGIATSILLYELRSKENNYDIYR